MEKIRELMKEVVYTDLADEFFVVKLECRVVDSLEWLEDKGWSVEHREDYVEHLQVIRACLTLLDWYTLDKDKYLHYLVEVNKHSLKLESIY